MRRDTKGYWQALLAVVLLLTAVPFPADAQETITITGEWEMSTTDSTHFDSYAILPGATLTAAGTHQGHVWLRKLVYIPDAWKNGHVTLELERAVGTTILFVNGDSIGSQKKRFVPHRYDISSALIPGQRNTILLRADNGAAGKLQLRKESRKLYLDHVTLLPKVEDGFLQMGIELGGRSTSLLNVKDVQVMVQEEGNDSADVYIVEYELENPSDVLSMPVGRARPWNEFQPLLYRLGINVDDNYYEKHFGMCRYESKGGRLFANNMPIWIHGIADGGHVANGYPPMDEKAWHRHLSAYKKQGFNCVFFYDFCPPDAAFSVADKLGLYLHVERIKDPSEQFDIFRAYCNHPSFAWWTDSVRIAPAEPGADNSFKESVERFTADTLYQGYVLPEGALELLRKEPEGATYIAPVVPLANLPRRHYTMGDTLRVPISIHNALYGNITSARTVYYISDENDKVVAGGQIHQPATIPLAQFVPVGVIELPLAQLRLPEGTLTKPKRLTLHINVMGITKNQWHFTVEPLQTAPEAPSEELQPNISAAKSRQS
ncbi:MAG: hypothetical protein K5764_01680 [Prevotella sp.]|nr:hypothetical protein [Prevotella sp.]